MHFILNSLTFVELCLPAPSWWQFLRREQGAEQRKIFILASRYATGQVSKCTFAMQDIRNSGINFMKVDGGEAKVCMNWEIEGQWENENIYPYSLKRILRTQGGG